MSPVRGAFRSPALEYPPAAASTLRFGSCESCVKPRQSTTSTPRSLHPHVLDYSRNGYGRSQPGLGPGTIALVRVFPPADVIDRQDPSSIRGAFDPRGGHGSRHRRLQGDDQRNRPVALKADISCTSSDLCGSPIAGSNQRGYHFAPRPYFWTRLSPASEADGALS